MLADNNSSKKNSYSFLPQSDFSMRQEGYFASNDQSTDIKSSYSDSEEDHGYDSSSSYEDDEDSKSEEDFSYNSGCLFLQNSLSSELGISLKEEIDMIEEFYGEISSMEKGKEMLNNLKAIESIMDKYIKKGIRLNFCYGDYNRTPAELVFELLIDVMSADNGLSPGGRALTFDRCDNSFDYDGSGGEVTEAEVLKDDNLATAKRIIRAVLLTGEKVQEWHLNSGEITHITLHDDYGVNGSIDKECRKIESELKNVVHQSIVSEGKQTLQNELKVELDNKCLCVRYMEGNTVKPAKILDNQKIKDKEIGVCLLQIGDSIVKVERVEGKRNYTDILGDKIEMFFATKAGEISICLNPSDDGSNKIKIEVSESDRKRLNKLKDKEEIGENCLLGGLSVNKAIEQGFFVKSKQLQLVEKITSLGFSRQDLAEQAGKRVTFGEGLQKDHKGNSSDVVQNDQFKYSVDTLALRGKKNSKKQDFLYPPSCRMEMSMAEPFSQQQALPFVS